MFSSLLLATLYTCLVDVPGGVGGLLHPGQHLGPGLQRGVRRLQGEQQEERLVVPIRIQRTLLSHTEVVKK